MGNPRPAPDVLRGGRTFRPRESHTGTINLSALIPTAATAIGLVAAALSLRIARAPGWRHQRWFAGASLAGASYAAVGAATNAGLADALLPVASGLQLAFAYLGVWAWLWYADGVARTKPRPLALVWRSFYACLALPAALLPYRLFDVSTARAHVLLGGHLVYRDVTATTLGDVLVDIAMIGLVPVMIRFAHAHRKGVPLAAFHAVSVGLMFPMALNDILNAAGVISTPYLLDAGFVLPIAAVAAATTARFVQEARELAALRSSLEAVVQERTRLLTRAQVALHEAERLASLGQFAAGIAHEVNNPAAAVTANLRFIVENADGGPHLTDILEAAEEGTAAMSRITALVRRLAEAGRLAAHGGGSRTCDLAEAVGRALDDAATRAVDGRVDFVIGRLEGIRVAAPEEDVHHAVLALLQNSAEAVPAARRGTVTLTAVRAPNGRIELLVEDDGAGPSAEALARAFEPFFTTKPPGEGPGLGLTLAQALARRNGGELSLERRERGGARARLVLPADGSAPEARAVRPDPDPADARNTLH